MEAQLPGEQPHPGQRRRDPCQGSGRTGGEGIPRGEVAHQYQYPRDQGGDRGRPGKRRNEFGEPQADQAVRQVLRQDEEEEGGSAMAPVAQATPRETHRKSTGSSTARLKIDQ